MPRQSVSAICRLQKRSTSCNLKWKNAYGWKLLGFRTCQGTGIESVEVSKNTVKIKGSVPARSRRASAAIMLRNRANRFMWAFASAQYPSFLKPAILMLPSPPVVRTEYPQIPPKVEHALSERGKPLMTVPDQLCVWGEKNKPGACANSTAE